MDFNLIKNYKIFPYEEAKEFYDIAVYRKLGKVTFFIFRKYCNRCWTWLKPIRNPELLILKIILKILQ